MGERAKDRLIPLILIGVGFAIYAIAGLLVDETGVFLAAVGLGLVVQVVLGLIALFITASVMSIEFGPAGAAVLKLAAIFIFPDAAAALIPVEVLDWLVAVILYLSLLAWLFDLEPLELIVCAVVIFLVRLVAGFIIVSAIVASA